MVTYSKKRRDQELTAANCIAPDLCEKIVASVSSLAVDFIFFIDEKIFTVAPPGEYCRAALQRSGRKRTAI